MSNIVVKISYPVATSNAVSELRTLLHQEVMTISEALRQQQILKTYTLFQNDHEECAQNLVALIAILRKHRVPFQLFELAASEFIDEKALPKHQITEEVLENILESHRQGILRQQRLSEQGL